LLDLPTLRGREGWVGLGRKLGMLMPYNATGSSGRLGRWHERGFGKEIHICLPYNGVESIWQPIRVSLRCGSTTSIIVPQRFRAMVMTLFAVFQTAACLPLIFKRADIGKDDHWIAMARITNISSLARLAVPRAPDLGFRCDLPPPTFHCDLQSLPGQSSR
jgi:hypothetical protein